MGSIRLATLFSGIGAPEQGASRVYDNVQTVFACEWDKFARQSYEANYDIDPVHFHADINDLDATQYRGKVDVIVGGSPCQSFSIAGKRKGFEDTRGTLFYEFARVLKETEVETFIYENVKGLVSHDMPKVFYFQRHTFDWYEYGEFNCVFIHKIPKIAGVFIDNIFYKAGYPSKIHGVYDGKKYGIGKTLKIIEEAFIELGYWCRWEILNTKHYNVPQNRERIYIIGFKDINTYAEFSFADTVPLKTRLKDILEDEVDDKYYLSQNTLKGFQAHSARHLDQGNGFKFQPTDGGGYCDVPKHKSRKQGHGQLCIKGYP